jgi:uncharacterized membrane protein (UPF0136 family)
MNETFAAEARDAAQSQAGWSPALVFGRGLLGAVVGGYVGYLLFRWLLSHGFYALVVPGAVMGLVAGLAARGRSQPLALACAIAAIALAVYAEWVRAPFAKDGSLLYFVSHLHQLDGAVIKFVMIGLGGACAYWFAQGR